jgi:hypothetical protein
LALGLLVSASVRAEPPAVVELFTSQGCSSCPPADKLLGELSQRSDVIALAYHVDYWDNLGWKDLFSTREATARQHVYGRSLSLSSVYTPQMVIDGHFDVVGSDRSEVFRALTKPRNAITLTASAKDGKLQFELPKTALHGNAEITLVCYSSAAETKIARGENAGKTLREFSIVRSIQSLGRWDGTLKQITVDLSSLPSDTDRAALLVQAEGQGAMLGAVALATK